VRQLQIICLQHKQQKGGRGKHEDDHHIRDKEHHIIGYKQLRRGCRRPYVPRRLVPSPPNQSHDKRGRIGAFSAAVAVDSRVVDRDAAAATFFILAGLGRGRG
jgi:hypothetical protein